MVASRHANGSAGLLATAGVLLAASLLFGGGSSDGPRGLDRRCCARWRRSLRARLRSGGFSLRLRSAARGSRLRCLAGGFVAWNGVTILWSAAPDRSWEYFNRGLVYLAFAVVGSVRRVGRRAAHRRLAARRADRRRPASGRLAGKAVPALYGDYGRLARLRSPVGYWNALALVVVFGLPLALWAATRPRHSRGSCGRAPSSCLYSLARRARPHVLARGRARRRSSRSGCGSR